MSEHSYQPNVPCPACGDLDGCRKSREQVTAGAATAGGHARAALVDLTGKLVPLPPGFWTEWSAHRWSTEFRRAHELRRDVADGRLDRALDAAAALARMDTYEQCARHLQSIVSSDKAVASARDGQILTFDELRAMAKRALDGSRP